MSDASRAHIFRRTIIDTLSHRLKGSRDERCEVTPTARVSPLKENDIPLILVIRNEVDRLEPFLNHYRGLGVTRFAILDDKSTDGTREFLESQGDVDVFTSPATYSQASRGNSWRHHIIDVYGRPRWFVIVDADEYLIYDGMDKHPLPSLIRWLERNRMKRLLAPMIDMYPAGDIRDARFDPSVAPWKIADHFDPGGYDIVRNPQHVKIRGGPRTRLFDRHTLTKYPLLFVDRSTIFKSIHSPLPYWHNHIEAYGALLHFKFFSDFSDRAEIAVAEGELWNNASKYRRYHEESLKHATFSAMTPQSARYEGVESIFKIDFINRIPW